MKTQSTQKSWHRSHIAYRLLPALLIAGICVSSIAAYRGSAKGKLYHVVAFKFKDSAAKGQVRNVEEAFADLKKKIKEVKSLQWGTNVSPENLNKGFTHGFILEFRTEKDRDVYLKHPDHQAFVALVKPILDDAFVIDFWSK